MIDDSSTRAPASRGPALTAGSPEVANLLDRLLLEMRRIVVGQDRAVERLLVALLARGHCLLEGVPGLAKTLAAETLARAAGGKFVRLQFTPDLIPSDIVGTRIYRASRESFDIELGPIFANVVLADEINRAPAKVQSALLEVMAERQVSIGGTTFDVPEPFLVMATQNPIESEGVYPLPEAQRDRFLLKLLVDYPSAIEEMEIVRRMGVNPPVARAVVDAETVVLLQQATDAVYVDPRVADYAVRLVLTSRHPHQHGLPDLTNVIAFGASPRASLGLVAAGKALAVLRGRAYLVPQDVFEVAPEVLRHRILLTYEALADGVDVEQVVSRILATTLAPRIVPMHEQVAVPGWPAPAPLPAEQLAPPPAGQVAVMPAPRAGVPQVVTPSEWLEPTQSLHAVAEPTQAEPGQAEPGQAGAGVAEPGAAPSGDDEPRTEDGAA